MSDQNNNQPSLTSTITALFSPTTLAALRYFLTAVSPLLALFGFTGLTPDRIDTWVAYAKTFGTASLALVALIGIVLPLGIAVLGILSATIKKQIARVRELAANPQLASEEAQKALVDATKAIATDPSVPKSAETVKTLITATRALDDVQTIVASPAIANSITDPEVVSSADNKVVAR